MSEFSVGPHKAFLCMSRVGLYSAEASSNSPSPWDSGMLFASAKIWRKWAL